jgi:serine/threonine protein kinase
MNQKYDGQNILEFPILDNKYYLFKKVGSGATCKVKLGYEIESGKKIAVKILKSASGPNGINTTSKHYYDEINMLKKINHHNVINLIDANKGVIKKPNGNNKHVDYIVFEFASNGELFDYLYFPKKGLGEYYSRNLFMQICEGLESCHISGVVHRDLKTENIMMDENWVLKIADFGYATLLAGKKGDGILKTHLGTVSYAAPEILSHKDYNGPCADIFSIGVILFVLVTGKLPFGKAHISDPMYKMIAKGDYENYWKVMSQKIIPISDNLISLFNLILAFEPLQRPSISEIKNHPWTLDSTSTNDELIKEFNTRKEIVVQLKALEAAEEKKQKMQMNQNKNRNVVYRSDATSEAENNKFEIFKDKRNIKDYNQENDNLSLNPYKFAIEGDDDNVEFLNSLCKAIGEMKDNEKPEIEANEKDSKFTVNFDIDAELKKDLADANIAIETLKVEIRAEKVEKNWYMVFFNKLSGDKHEFYELFDGVYEKFSKENKNSEVSVN